MVCTPLLQGPRRKGGFCAPLRRYTPYTNNSRSNYQIRIHSRARGALFSLCSPHSFPLPPPYISTRGGGCPGSLLLARRFARARMNGDLSRRWERGGPAARRTFFFFAAGRRLEGETRARGRKAGVGFSFSSKINTYSCDFITDGYVRPMRARPACTCVSWRWRNVRAARASTDITRVIPAEPEERAP